MHTLMEAMVCTEAPWSQPATALTQAGHFWVVTLQFPVQVWVGRRDDHTLLPLAAQDTAG